MAMASDIPAFMPQLVEPIATGTHDFGDWLANARYSASQAA
jgi:hypothetical protein